MKADKQSDTIYLRHILECIGHARHFTEGMETRFHTVPEKWFATLRVLQVMSESAIRLTDEAKAVMVNVEWYRIKGFRNILVHDYLGDIDPEIVRKVIEIELPRLEMAINAYIKGKPHD